MKAKGLGELLLDIPDRPAMLDGYADRADDLADDGHCYIGHYPTEQIAVERVREVVRRATREARALRDGHRHAVVTACMIAMYLSKDSALAPGHVWRRSA